MVVRKAMASTKPDITIEVDGNKFTITTSTTLKTMKVEFTLGEAYEADPGVGTKDTYLTTMEGNKLVTKVVSKDKVISSREFNDSGFVQTYFADGGVTGTRTFKKN